MGGQEGRKKHGAYFKIQKHGEGQSCIDTGANLDKYLLGSKRRTGIYEGLQYRADT